MTLLTVLTAGGDLANTAASAGHWLNHKDLGLSEIAFSVFGWPIRWYALAYLAGIFLGYWYLLRLVRAPGAPIASRHVDDIVLYAMLGIILGGRLGYVLFYNLGFFLANPGDILKLWDGGMSLHGGAAGVMLAIWLYARKHGLSVLRFFDYVACVIPFGLFLGRIANFINGELWGRPTTVPWAVIFPDSGTMDPRHPSQLYEAGLEGLVMMIILTYLFWRTDARYRPGFLFGVAAIIYGLSRFIVEFFRQPDEQLGTLSWGLTMGQTLTLPLLIAGVYAVLTANGRRVRVEPTFGNHSVS